MRRSAAPSQLHKRALGQFRPPFATPPSKRPCLETSTGQENSGNNQFALSKERSGSAENTSSVNTPKINTVTECISSDIGPLRSPKDILSLLKKPPLEKDKSADSTVNQADSAMEKSQTVLPCLKERETVRCPMVMPVYPSPSSQRVLAPNTLNSRTSSSQNVLSSRAFTNPLLKTNAAGNTITKIGSENQEPPLVKYYSVVWCKRSNKKHKKWEGDAVLITKSRSVTLKDTDGKDIGHGSGYKLADLATLEDGCRLPIGGKEVEIQGVISPEDFSSGKCFQGSMVVEAVPSTIPAVSALPKPKPFRLPTRNATQTDSSVSLEGVGPLYDTSSPDAFVMPRPPSHHQWKHNMKKAPVVDVIVDPHISKHLRPHQHEGILFLYECVMGFKVADSHGAILADEMGLGKTLQCIALVWTLLKQGPYGRMPVLKRVLVVTPSSLCVNWGKEFKKWLGSERLKVYIVDQQNKVEKYAGHNDKPVMIISYEMFMRSAEVIEAFKFDLILCDEGHRLKNSNIKTTSLLTNISCRRRVILTGTPVQNDLKEFFALVEFVNPGVFGSSTSFRHVYEDPILKSQQPCASEADKDLGSSRASQLNRITSLFTLRRTQEIINRYLPPKVEYVVFCQPSETQLSLYDEVVSCRSLRQILNSMDASDHFSAILSLRKLCNHPALLAQADDNEGCSDLAREISNILPDHIKPNQFEEADSGKLAVVSCMLWSLAEVGKEKIVIVSNFTKTLDMIAHICNKYNYNYFRLDGSTPSSKRQSMVDQFNNFASSAKVFLLSAKAGGVGLNLIGASRIVLYDIDWNPATDLQAMARVWRDGQKRKVFIYRLLMTGSMDEKMYQRQVKKQRLSGAVVDSRESEKTHFSTAELKDLFTLHKNTPCLTHDLLKCNCDLSGSLPTVQQPQPVQNERACQLGATSKPVSTSNTTMDQLHSWCHIKQPFPQDVINDHCLEAASDFVTFLFQNESSNNEVS